MNPYERTAAEMKRQSEGPKRFAKTAAAVGTALGATSFAPILARAAPFLSQYIPEDLAVKGLSKISPKLGSFVKSAIDGGYDFQQVKDFIGNQINQSQNKETPQQPAKEDRNIVQQYSPELHSFLSEKIKGGENPVVAAAYALFAKGNPYEPIIRKIEKDHKISWADLVKSVYGGGQGQPPAQAEQIKSESQQQQQQPQGQGQGAQALQSILQKINQRLGG